MNVVLWILQAFLAFHTLMGAGWKLGNSEQTVPTLSALPHGVWLGLAGLELVCAVGLILPALLASTAFAAPIAALVIAGEMLLFVAVHKASGSTENGPVGYWLVVAGLGVALAVGRLALG